MLFLALLACQPQAVYCDSPTAHIYDPLHSDRLDAWPDDIFTVDDPSSPTGSRISVVDTAWYGELPELLQSIAIGVEGSSGFGTQAELNLRFTGEIGALPSVAESTTTDAIQLWDLEADPPERRPYEARLGDQERQLLLLPVGPLNPKSRHALIITRAQTDREGRCMAPSAVLRTVLDRDAEGVWQEREKPVKELLSDLDIERDDVTALLSFTTHSDHLPFLDAAEEAREAEQSWSSPLSCTQLEGYRECETSFDPIDFRGPDQRVEPGGTERHRVNVTFWLPDGVEDPPIVLFGHGLGQQRQDGVEVARILAPLGVALVGSDALYHGEHPSTGGSPDPAAFLGLSIDGGISFDLAKMRSSFDASNLERRQLLTLLGDLPDVDGDGTPEFSTDRIGYVGISLGGILGSGLLAISDDIDAAVLAIAGGNLVSIVRDTEAVAAFRPLFIQLAGSAEELEMSYSVLQTAIDPSDPTLYAASVLHRRVSPGAPPSVFLPVSTTDEVVPFAAGKALARAFGLPPVQPVSIEVPGLPESAPTPVMSNGPDDATIGYFQYDRMTLNGELQPSRHVMPRSEEFTEQLTHFIITWLDGRPEIIDPFESLGTPDLP